MFTYSNLEYTETKKKYGAFTKDCDEELQYKQLTNTHIFDFQSLYPSVGIQCNISPETIVEHPTKNKIDINCYKKTEEEIVYFDD